MRIKLFLMVLAATIVSAKGVVISEEDKARAQQLVSQMTLEEKISYLSGETSFSLRPIERLGVPRILLADGPQGIRNHCEHSTLYPCGVAAAASWNRNILRRFGEGLGDDARARGVGILLGPGVNIYRLPLCGRNFEYMGEDPYLTSEMACNYIEGVQSKGVIATIKHFAANNNHEWQRHHTSSDVDERTLQEIYFPAFRKAVEKAGVGAVMNSYNLLNGVHSSENKWLNTSMLRDAWGFDGILMSDWTSVYSTVNSANSGLDLEMPKAVFFTDSLLKAALNNGRVSIATIDNKVAHLLQTFSAFGLLDREQKTDSPLDNPQSRATALAIAEEGIVLLKNEGNILPLKGKTIVVGLNADTIVSGGGSGAVSPFSFTSLAAALPSVKDIAKADNVVINTGFTSATEGEGMDRSYGLPEKEVELIREVAAVNPNVVVVLNAGGAVDVMPWIDSVKGLLMAWYPGQEGGTALAEILTGKISPSGRLPFTWYRNLEDSPAYGNFFANRTKTRSSDTKECQHIEYKEGLFHGYRGSDKSGISPLYPFGYGLSYTTFEFSDLALRSLGDNRVEVKFSITNTGKKQSAEVAQVYVHDVESSEPRPLKELKGFEKVSLKPGESRVVTIVLDEEAFAYYDVERRKFVVEPGDFEILVGNSSSNLPLKATISL